jgi:holliday junction DNA helicase RuvA
MISSINGLVQSKERDALVINVGGVGFHVFVPAATLDGCELNHTLGLFTYLLVRENMLALYGFDTEEQREFFLLLLEVNGVGPKVAMSILSALSLDNIRNAVMAEEPAIFSRVPGVGRKTAEKILLHLKDKLPSVAGGTGLKEFSDVDGEVLDALTSLGYSVVEAQRAIQSISKDVPQDVESKLLQALKYFS